MCLARTPLIQSYLSRVPLPLHCNNIDITETSISVRPETEPTDLSLLIQKFKFFRVFNKFYKENCDHIHRREFVEAIDAELMHLEESSPWFQKIENLGRISDTPSDLDHVPWGNYILHSCLCQQRLRMYRPFLQARIPEAWDKCVHAAESALDVYRALRAQNLGEFRRSSKFKGTSYQIFSVATFLSLFLLIERPSPADKIRSDIDIVLSDLEYGSRHHDCHPAQAERTKVLRQIIAICDSQDPTSRPNATMQIIRIISTVFGGESSSRSYLNRERPARPRIAAARDANLSYNEGDGHASTAHGDDQPSEPTRLDPDTPYIHRSEACGVSVNHRLVPPDAHSDTTEDSINFDFNMDMMPYDLWQWDQWDSLFSDHSTAT